MQISAEMSKCTRQSNYYLSRMVIVLSPADVNQMAKSVLSLGLENIWMSVYTAQEYIYIYMSNQLCCSLILLQDIFLVSVSRRRIPCGSPQSISSVGASKCAWVENANSPGTLSLQRRQLQRTCRRNINTMGIKTMFSYLKTILTLHVKVMDVIMFMTQKNHTSSLHQTGWLLVGHCYHFGMHHVKDVMLSSLPRALWLVCCTSSFISIAWGGSKKLEQPIFSDHIISYLDSKDLN